MLLMKNVLNPLCRCGRAVAAAWLLMTPLTSLPADDSPTDPAFRKKFIAGFQRTILNTTPGDATLLRILVESSQAKRGVEVGTATGYGAIHMGLGFERNGGRLLTVDIDPAMVRKARENLKAVGLEKIVTVLEGDALKVLPTLEGEFDFVFIDALKRDYFQYFKALAPKLKPGTVIVADNVIQSREDMKDFLEFMENSPDYQMVIVRASTEKGDGMAICYKRR
jgi:predicted O-methyltransferase YrrM